MTPADFEQAAVDLDLHRRAGARCAAAEPHRDPGEDWPCRRCVNAVSVQLAIASHLSAPAPASSCVAPQPHAEGASGAAGPCAGTAARPGPAAPPSVEGNQPRAENPRLAESGTVLPQTGR